jgi:DNA-binding CsgD family transcriptional regulator
MWPATAGGRTSLETRDVFATPGSRAREPDQGMDQGPQGRDGPGRSETVKSAASGESVTQSRRYTAMNTDLPDQAASAHRAWVAAGFLLGAIARDAALIPGSEDLLARVVRPVPPPGKEGMGRRESHKRGNSRLALTHGEIRVLHYLPTNLSAREIAGELCVSANTVKTHQRHLYQKLGVRSRSQAVERARAAGLLAPSSRGRGQ